MEKGKQTEKLSNIKHAILGVFTNIFQLFSRSLNKIISQVHFLDPKDNTKQRIVTSLILFPIAIYAIFFSQILFNLLSVALAVLMSWEWLNITKSTTGEEKKKWQLIGFFYIVIPVFSVIQIRSIDVDILFWMFAIIWTTDIFAFFSGRTFGGPKLASEISPNKTWSGLAGGIISSVIIGLLCSSLFQGSVIFFMFASMCLSILEQLSDLFESKVKRIFKVKDSGNIIPGHGGVLDRLDGMMFVAPTVLILVTILPDRF
ncbi:MAG: phosphatidate cytidylyltransferase [Rickettsiales bacterium]|nr:phosphatidate cytidylyltransferase [Rickettsiales bacterium]